MINFSKSFKAITLSTSTKINFAKHGLAVRKAAKLVVETAEKAINEVVLTVEELAANPVVQKVAKVAVKVTVVVVAALVVGLIAYNKGHYAGYASTFPRQYIVNGIVSEGDVLTGYSN